jgi:hypothetical protein
MRRESKGPLMIDRGEVLERVVRACTLSYKKEKLKADCMNVAFSNKVQFSQLSTSWELLHSSILFTVQPYNKVRHA